MPLILVGIFVILAVATVDGFKNGVIRRLLETAGLIVIFIFASRLADFVEPYMTEHMAASPKVAFFGSWAIVIVGGVITVRILAAAASSLMTISVVGTLDHIGGAVVGLLFGSLLTSLILVGMLALPLDKDLERDLRDNPVTDPLLHLAPGVYDAAAGLWHGEGFFEMIQDRLEPLAGEARESIRAFLEEVGRDDSGEN